MKTMSDHYISIGLAKITPKLTTHIAGENVEPQELSFLAGGTGTWRSHLGRRWRLLIKLNIDLPDDLAIGLLDINSTGLKANVHVQTGMWTFTDVILINAKDWKQPRCPPIGQWMSKLWYIHTMEYYSVSKKKK